MRDFIDQNFKILAVFGTFTGIALAALIAHVNAKNNFVYYVTLGYLTFYTICLALFCTEIVWPFLKPILCNPKGGNSDKSGSFKNVLLLLIGVVVSFFLILLGVLIYSYFTTSPKQQLLKKLNASIEKCECDTTKLIIYNSLDESYNDAGKDNSLENFKKLIEIGKIPHLVEIKVSCSNNRCVLDMVSSGFVNTPSYQTQIEKTLLDLDNKINSSKCKEELRLSDETHTDWKSIQDFRKKIKEGVISIPVSIEPSEASPCALNILFKK